MVLSVLLVLSMVAVSTGGIAGTAAADDTTNAAGGTNETVVYTDDFGGDNPLKNYSTDSGVNVESKIDGSSLHIDGNDASNPRAFLNADKADMGTQARLEFDFTVDGSYTNQNIQVRFVTAETTWQVKVAVFGDTLRFKDLNSDKQKEDNSVSFEPDTTYRFVWTFDNDSSTVSVGGESLTYNHESTYDLRTVGFGIRSPQSNNKDGESWFDNVEITAIETTETAATTAAFDVTPAAPNATDPVRFNASNSTANGSITSYEWDFGDNTTATGEVVNHTYDSPGNYTVNLTVTDDSGATNATNRTVTVQPSDDLVVEAGNESAPYRKITNAVDNASDGDRVTVRPGQYNGSEVISVDRNISVVAPDGAVVDQADSGRSVAFEVGTTAEPTIRGFEVRGFDTGVDAANTEGAWRVEEFEADGVSPAVDAFDSEGAWTVAGLTTNATTAVNARQSSGDWTANGIVHRPARFSTAPGSAGLEAADSTGNWTVADSEFTNVSTGVGAANADGAWTVRGTTLEAVETGVFARETDGAWTATRVTATDASLPVDASDSTGAWTVSEATVEDSGRLLARRSEGDWTVADSTLVGTEGIGAPDSTGDWVVRNTTVRNGSFQAVYAHGAAGDWTVESATVEGHAVGVDAGTGAASSATGAWTVRNTTVRDTATGIRAVGAGVGWTATNVTIAAGTAVDASASSSDWEVNGADLDPGDTAVDATDSTGDWSVAGTNVSGGATGVDATDSDGDWRLESSNVSGTSTGVDASGSDGAWTVHDTSIEALSTTQETRGVRADGSTGDWAVRDSRVRTSAASVLANGSTGDWHVENATVESLGLGDGLGALNANRSSGDWLVNGTTNVTTGDQPGVMAAATSGAWEIHRTNFVVDLGYDVFARGAEVRGNARRNWFAPGTASFGCEGNVTCANPLGEPASPDATGIDVTVYNGSEDRPYEDVEVYAYDTNATAPGVTAGVVENVYDGDEDLNVSAVVNRTDAINATTGEEGYVRLTGLNATRHCLLVVPPSESPRNVRGECTAVSAESITDEEYVLTGGGFGPDAWSQFQKDPQNTGVSSTDGLNADPVLQWEFTTGESIKSAPVVANGTVYVTTVQGTLYAFDAETGERQWTYEVSGGTNGVAAWPGVVFVRADRTLHAVDAETGIFEWKADVQAGTFERTSITISNGTVYVPVSRGDGDGGIVAYDAASGQKRWELDMGDYGASQSRTTPSVAGGLVYVGGRIEQVGPAARTVLAADTESGALEWGRESATIRASPTVVGDSAYFANNAGAVAVLDPETGEFTDAGTDGVISPEGSSNNDILGSQAVDGDEVYFGVGGLTETVQGSNGTFFRVDRDSGAADWNVSINGAPVGSPAATDEVVYVVGARAFSGQVYGIDRASGNVRWKRPTDGRIEASPAISDGTLYVATDRGNSGGTVYALTERSWSGVPVPPSEPIGDIGDVDVGETAASSFDASDPTAGERFGDDVHYEATTFDGSAGETVDVELLSTQEGAYVYLLGPSGDVLARNGSYVPHDDPSDPSEGGAVSEASLYRLDGVTLPSDGTYTVIAASNYPVSAADSRYELTIGSPSIGGSGGGSAPTGDNGADGASATDEVAGSDVVAAVTVGEGSADGPVEASAADLPADAPEPGGDPVAYVDIEAPDPAAGATTVTVDIDSDAVGDADLSSLQLWHYDEAAGTWEQLPTTASADGGTVSVQGEAESFSLFAVTVGTETATATPAPTRTPTADGTASSTPASTETATVGSTPRATDGDGAGPGIGIAVAALLGAALLARRRRR